MSQPTPEYALKICIINQDGDEERFEIVPTVSEEQGNEAIHRMVSYHDNHLKVAEINDDEE